MLVESGQGITIAFFDESGINGFLFPFPLRDGGLENCVSSSNFFFLFTGIRKGEFLGIEKIPSRELLKR